MSRITRSSSDDKGQGNLGANPKKLTDKSDRRAKSQAIDPKLLKELAKKAQGLDPEEGMEAIIQEMKRIDPSIEIPEDSKAWSRKNSVADDTIGARAEALKQTALKQRIVRSESVRPKPVRGSILAHGKQEKEESLAKRVSAGGVKTKIDPNKRLSRRIVNNSQKEKRFKYEMKRKFDAVERDATKWLIDEEGYSQPVDELLQPKPNFPFDDYRFVYDVASRIHGVGTVPEIVLVGINGTGKSQLLEALIGHPINIVGYSEGGKTKRPLFVHFVSNEVHNSPKCTILQTEKKSDQVSISAVPAEILKNSDLYFTPEPVHLQYEFSKCLNFLIVDTPGLPFDTDSDEYGQVEIFLAEFLRAPNRLLVCVEDAGQADLDTTGGTEVVREMVKKVDPYGRRTVTVYNKFHSLSETFTSAMECNKYLKRTSSPNSFWMTLLANKEHEAAVSSRNFADMIAKVEERDKKTLHTLRADSKFFNNFGISALRKHILHWIWNTYHKQEIPRLFRDVSGIKKQVTQEVDEKEQQIANLNLKKLATQYASKYVEIAQAILQGTARGNPAVNGETLREEVDEQFFASAVWEVPNSKSIPFEETKLYGGQQFERVFSEFKAIVGDIEITETETISLPETTDKKFFFSVCEVAQSYSEEKLIPLIEQLIERSVFVMKRTPEIVVHILGGKDKNLDPRYKLSLAHQHYTPLATYLKDLFNASVDKHAEKTKHQCMEEFYNAKTIFWFMSGIFSEEETKDASISGKIFSNIRDRIINNVLRKVYNLFLLPFFQEELWDEIQTHIFKLDQPTLEEVFDSNSIEEHLDHELEELEVALERIHEEEVMLHDIAPRLARL